MEVILYVLFSILIIVGLLTGIGRTKREYAAVKREVEALEAVETTLIRVDAYYEMLRELKYNYDFSTEDKKWIHKNMRLTIEEN